MAEGEEVRQAARVNLPRNGGVGEDRLDLRTEDQPPMIVVVIERLLTDPVAREEQAVARLVPDGNGKHAIEAFQAIRPPFFIGMQDDFGVAVRAEHMAFRLQLRTQIEEVVNLAVKDNAAGLILVPNRLLPAGQINDAEPAHPKEDLPSHPGSIFVRAAMQQPVRGQARAPFVNCYWSYFSVNAAHGNVIPVAVNRLG